jgi:hypothetical protein
MAARGVMAIKRSFSDSRLGAQVSASGSAAILRWVRTWVESSEAGDTAKEGVAGLSRINALRNVKADLRTKAPDAGRSGGSHWTLASTCYRSAWLKLPLPMWLVGDI